jgi:hypothetical protein
MKWNENHTRHFHFRVAAALEHHLNEVQVSLSSDSVDLETCEEICHAISTIPFSMLQGEKEKEKNRTETEKKQSQTHHILSMDRTGKARSIYEGEMFTEEERNHKQSRKKMNGRTNQQVYSTQKGSDFIRPVPNIS